MNSYRMRSQEVRSSKKVGIPVVPMLSRPLNANGACTPQLQLNRDVMAESSGPFFGAHSTLKWDRGSGGSTSGYHHSVGEVNYATMRPTSHKRRCLASNRQSEPGPSHTLPASWHCKFAGVLRGEACSSPPHSHCGKQQQTDTPRQPPSRNHFTPRSHLTTRLSPGEPPHHCNYSVGKRAPTSLSPAKSFTHLGLRCCANCGENSAVTFTTPCLSSARPPGCNTMEAARGRVGMEDGREEEADGEGGEEEGKKGAANAVGVAMAAGSRPSPLASHPLYPTIHHPSDSAPAHLCAYFTTTTPQPQSAAAPNALDEKEPTSMKALPERSDHKCLPSEGRPSLNAPPSPHSSYAAVSNATNRNSTGSSGSQTTYSSGYESVKVGCSSSPSSQTLANSQSTSSCTASNIEASPGSERDESQSVTISCIQRGSRSTPVVSYSSCRSSICSTSTVSDGRASTSRVDLPQLPGTTISEQHKKKRRVDIGYMLKRGVPEAEVMAEWLQRLSLSQYLPLFISHGFDLLAIAKSTPEDLTALGITSPEDRRLLIHDIHSWDTTCLDDKWPSHVEPDTGIREWLKTIGLLQYLEVFEEQGYSTMRDLATVTWEDLEDVGVKKLGHMRRIALAMKKLQILRREHAPTEATAPSPRLPLMLRSGDATKLLLPPASSPMQQMAEYGQFTATPSSMSHRRHSQPSAIRLRPEWEGEVNGTGVSQRPKPALPPPPPVRSDQLYTTAGVGPPGCELFSPQHSIGSGAELQPRVQAPPLLSLYRTSRILSEFAEFPISLDGLEMRPATAEKVDCIRMQSEVPDRIPLRSPPSPAPQPSCTWATFPTKGGLGEGCTPTNGRVQPVATAKQSNIAQIDHMLRDLSTELDSIHSKIGNVPQHQRQHTQTNVTSN